MAGEKRESTCGNKRVPRVKIQEPKELRHQSRSKSKKQTITNEPPGLVNWHGNNVVIEER